LGSELCRQIGSSAIPLDIDVLDLTDAGAVVGKILSLRPDVVINCAAYTQVDKAETEPQRAEAVNAMAVKNLATACEKLDCALVQISTDYVFGGDRVQGPGFGVHDSSAERPYREDDLPRPQSVYARTKLAGERAAAKWKKHIIVRSCGLYARQSDRCAHNFVKTMLGLGRTRSEVRVVADQHCTPSYVPHVARAVLFLTGAATNKPAPWGVYHVTNTGATTWHEFATEIFRQAAMNVSVVAITSAEYSSAAVRPGYSVLDTAAYHRLRGPAMPDWKAALAEYFVEWRRLQS